MNSDAIRGHLDDLILAVLTAGPSHGYAIIQALRDRSDGVLDVPEGSLYPALYRLERAGLLASEWSQDSPRRRRVYRLTARSQTALAKGRADWRRMAAGINAVLMAGEAHA